MLARIIQLDDRIRVAAVFRNGEIKPVWFGLDGKKHLVKEVAYNWESREGRALLVNFAVWDGSDTWTLTYNTCNQVWSLGKAVIEDWTTRKASLS